MTTKSNTNENMLEYSTELLINEKLSEDHALLDLIFERQQQYEKTIIIVEPNTEIIIPPTNEVSKYGHYLVITEKDKRKMLINTEKIIYIK